MDRGSWWATVHGIQRVAHDWSDLACTQALLGLSRFTCHSLRETLKNCGVHTGEDIHVIKNLNFFREEQLMNYRVLGWRNKEPEMQMETWEIFKYAEIFLRKRDCVQSLAWERKTIIRGRRDRGANFKLPWYGRTLKFLSSRNSCFINPLFSEMFKNIVWGIWN